MIVKKEAQPPFYSTTMIFMVLSSLGILFSNCGETIICEPDERNHLINPYYQIDQFSMLYDDDDIRFFIYPPTTFENTDKKLFKKDRVYKQDSILIESGIDSIFKIVTINNQVDCANTLTSPAIWIGETSFLETIEGHKESLKGIAIGSSPDLFFDFYDSLEVNGKEYFDVYQIPGRFPDEINEPVFPVEILYNTEFGILKIQMSDGSNYMLL